MRNENDIRDHPEIKNYSLLHNLTEKNTAHSLITETRKSNDGIKDKKVSEWFAKEQMIQNVEDLLNVL